MLKIFIAILVFIFSVKFFLFWLWLWQIKNYHLGRFKAHFETQPCKKFFASFFRNKIPEFTRKMTVIFIFGLFLISFVIFYTFLYLPDFFYFIVLLLLFFNFLFSSLLVLFFQIPTVILRGRILKKAERKRKSFKNLKVIAITGSYGKTSTKEFLAEILSEKFGREKVLRTKKHQNSEMGISRCILNELNQNHQIFVVEMGAYNKGGIKLLAEIAKPDTAIITGVNEQHLSTFGSMENLISAEGGKELVNFLPKNGLVIFNGNNKYCRDFYQEIPNGKIDKKICYSNFFEEKDTIGYDLKAESINITKEDVSFLAVLKNKEKEEFRAGLLGAQNVENILLATCCSLEMGMSLEEISRACLKLKPFAGQMELKKGIYGINIIDSSYSANPEGVMAHLNYLKVWPGKKSIIMPCLIELGTASKEVHRKLGRKIAEVCDLAIIMTEDNYKEIREGFLSLKKDNIGIFLIKDPASAIKKVKKHYLKENENSAILLEGRVPEKLIKELTIENEN